MALVDSIKSSQLHAGTYLGKSLRELNNSVDYDRIIVLTDEQTRDTLPAPIGKGYIINVATSEKGVGYGQYTHINGFSEAVINYIIQFEANVAN
jgi:hypothetical protein